MVVKARIVGLSLFLALLVAGRGTEASDPAAYSFIVLGDTHYDGALSNAYHADGGVRGNSTRMSKFRRNRTNWESLMPELLNNVQSQEGAEFVVHVGDMIQGDCEEDAVQGRMLEEALEAYCRNLPKCGGAAVPFLPVVGNHDMRSKGKDRGGRSIYEGLIWPRVETSLADGDLALEGRDGETYWFRREFDENGRKRCDRFLFLDYSVGDPLATVAEWFAHAEEDAEMRYAFVVCHKAVSVLDPADHGKKGKNEWLLSKKPKKHEKLESFCRDHGVIWISGHIHRMAWKREDVTGGLAEISVNSVGRVDSQGRPQWQEVGDWQDGPGGNHRYLDAAGFVRLEVSSTGVWAWFFLYDGSVRSRVCLRAAEEGAMDEPLAETLRR